MATSYVHEIAFQLPGWAHKSHQGGREQKFDAALVSRELASFPFPPRIEEIVDVYLEDLQPGSHFVQARLIMILGARTATRQEALDYKPPVALLERLRDGLPLDGFSPDVSARWMPCHALFNVCNDRYPEGIPEDEPPVPPARNVVMLATVRAARERMQLMTLAQQARSATPLAVVPAGPEASDPNDDGDDPLAFLDPIPAERT